MSLYEYIHRRIVSLKGHLWSSQQQLAERSGIGQSQISRYLKGERGLTLEAACNLLEALGATVIFPGDSPHRDTDPAAETPQPSVLEAELRRTLRESIPQNAEPLYASRIYPNIPKAQAVARLQSLLDGKKSLTIQDYYPIAAAASDFKPGTLLDTVASDIVTRATQISTESMSLKEPTSPRMAYGPQKLQEPETDYKA